MSRVNKQRKQKMRRRRGASNSHRPNPSFDEISKRSDVVLLSYDVTFEPLQSESSDEAFFAALGETKTAELFDLVRDDPAKAIEQLRTLLQAHRSSQVLVQWLCAALQGAGQTDEYQRLAELNYQNHPDYLFARLDYFKSLMHAGQLQTVEELLHRQFDLKLMYPQRNEFHISELMAFNSFMIEFRIRSGELELAKPYLLVMKKLMPDASLTVGCAELLEHATFMHRLKLRTNKLLGRAIFKI